MIRAAGLTLRRGVKVLLENAEFVVHPGERVGIVGKNGAGKSSLFALLQGHIDPDAGTLDIPASWRLASVEQILHDTDRPAREFVIDGDRHLRELQARRAALDPDQGQGSPNWKPPWSRPRPGAHPRAPNSCWPAWASPPTNGPGRSPAFPAAGRCASPWRAH